jgi:hypothetical protein
MKNLARVGLSVLLLGTCALAIRFSMVKTDVPEFKPQTHTAKIALGNVEEIQLDFEATDSQHSIEVRAGQPGFIAGRYKATQAHELRIIGNARDGALETQFQTGRKSYNSFLLGRPEYRGETLILLPPSIPLFVDVGIMPFPSTNKVLFDLRGLNVQKFWMPPTILPTINLMDLYVPVGTIDTELTINGLIKKTNIWIKQASKGNLRINSHGGLVNVIGRKNAFVAFNIHGKANSLQDFSNRIQLGGFHKTSKAIGFPKTNTQFDTRYFLLSNDETVRHEITVNVELGDTGTINYSEQP